MAAAYALSGPAGLTLPVPVKQLPFSSTEQSRSTSTTAATLSSMAAMPPPAPPPTQPTQAPHPLPLPPRSLYQPWHPVCSLQWYTTQSPSIRSGLSPLHIAATHNSAFLFLATLSLTLRYPFPVLERAASLYHRFYARHSIAQYEVRRTAAVCLFLASKVEDAPRRLIELIRQYELMRLQEDEELSGKSMEVWKERELAARKAVEHSKQPTHDPVAASDLATQPLYPSLNASPASLASPVLPEQQRERDKLDRLTAREHELRSEFVSLESEVLLAIDFDFTFPLPSHYIRLLVRQLVLSPPRTDSTGKGREGWEEEVRRVAWERAMWKGGETIVVQAMRTLQGGLLTTTSYLHFSPHCIAVLCVIIACRTISTDIERLVQLGGWVTIASAAAMDKAELQPADMAVEVKEEAADVRFSPSSVTSTTPSFSPLYAVSPTSPTTASPASLSSIQSSPSQPPALQPASSTVTATPSPVPLSSAPVTSPYTVGWIRRVLPDVSVDELVSLFGLLCAHPPLFEQPAVQLNDMRRFVMGAGKVPSRSREDADVLDVLHVRAEYEAVVSEKVEERRLRELESAQKVAEEERRRREEEEERSRVKLVDEKARRRVRDDGKEVVRPVSSERQPWAPHSPPRAYRPGGRGGGRGGGGWQADRAAQQQQRPAFAANREAGSWRGAGHRGGWAGRQQPNSQSVGWQSTVVDPAAAAPTPLHPLSHSSYSHRRAGSPGRHRSPSPPPKRKRSLSRSPTRRSSSGRDRDREWERDRDGRGLREGGDRQQRRRSRSLSPESPSERYRGSSRSKRYASPSPERDRGRGRR